MQKLLYISATVYILMAFAVPASWAQQLIETERDRRGQTGMKFLSRSVDPRAAAMANAVTSQNISGTAMFYNPAGMANLGQTVNVALNQTQWIGDFDYNAGSVAFQPAEGAYGTVGVSLIAANYGEFFETIRANTEQGYRNIGTYSPSATALGLGYARAITDRFSVGGHVKYARQSLGASTMRLDESDTPMREDNKVSTVAVDFGVIYKTAFRSLNIAMSARNFSQELTYQEESFELPLTFQIGVSMDMLDFTQLNQEMHTLLFSIDAQRPRDYYEQIRAGGEYVFMDLLSLRAGYIFPSDEQGVTVGAGLNLSVADVNFRTDYAYAQFGVFGHVNRIGVQISL